MVPSLSQTVRFYHEGVESRSGTMQTAPSSGLVPYCAIVYISWTLPKLFKHLFIFFFAFISLYLN